MAREFSIPPDQLARQKMLEAQEAVQIGTGKRPSHDNKVQDLPSSVPPKHTESERAASRAQDD